MEFIKVGKNYMIKGSNGRIISEKEKLELENNELVLKDIKGCGCQEKTTKKISKNKKRIKEIEKKEKIKETDKKLEEIEAVLEEVEDKEEVSTDDTIEETDKSI